MTIALYHYHESLCSQKVRIALAEKDVSYDSQIVMIDDVVENGDNLTDSYLQVNPTGTVPTLVHDGKSILDSWEIIKYIDNLYPAQGATLYPGTSYSSTANSSAPKELHAPVEEKNGESNTAILDTLVAEASLTKASLNPSTLGLAIPMVSVPILHYCLRQQPFWHVVKKYLKHPIRFRGLFFISIRCMPSAPKPRKQALVNLAEALLRADKMLEKTSVNTVQQQYLMGEFCMIDVMMMAHFHRLEDVALGKLLTTEKLPYLKSYWQRLQARPSYKTAVLDWHEPTWRNALEQIWGGRDSEWLSTVLGHIDAMR